MRREVKIGAFALGMVLLLYLAINFVKGMDLFGGSTSYYTAYPKVSGLQPRSQIFIKGIAVGTVGNITLSDDLGGDVIVQLNIRSRYRIPSDSEAMVFTDGLMGGKAIEIVAGLSGDYLDKGDTIRPSLEKDPVEAISSGLESITSAGGGLVDNFTETAARINALMEQNTESVNMAMNNLAAISADLKNITSSQNARIQSLITNLSQFSASLNGTSEDMAEAMANVNALTDSLKHSGIPLVINNLAEALDRMNVLLDRVNSGQGTMGRLMNDEELYDSLATSLGTLNRLMQDLQEHPGRYINLTIFGRKNPR